MLESMPVSLLIGTVLGFLAGLGVGGGSLLLLWLTLVLDMAPQQAQSINLLFFLPAAVVSCLFRHGNGSLPIKKLLPGLLSGAAAAGVFTLLSSTIDPQMLRKPFGILLLLTGLRELFYRRRNPR